MRKVLLLAASALLIPGMALADGEAAAPASASWFYGAGAGWTQMEMPEYGNGARTFDTGAGFEPLTEQADVDGVSYGFGIGRNTASGWRIGLYAQFFDGDGSSSSAVTIPLGADSRRGTLDGTLQGSGLLGVTFVGDQTLQVDVTQYWIGLGAGHQLTDMLRWDVIASYDSTGTDYDHVVDVLGGIVGQNIWTSSTNFEARTWELAARLSGNFGLMDDISLGLGGSAGWGLRNIEMKTVQRFFTAGPVLASDSTLVTDDDLEGFIGRLDASLNYAVSPATMISLTAGYKYDDMVPTYVPPVYPPAGVGTAATFTTESQSSMTYGLRLVGRF
jgi:hypothetical protein